MSKRSRRRTIEAAFLIAAAVGLILYQHASMTTASAVSSVFALVAGVVLLARRAR